VRVAVPGRTPSFAGSLWSCDLGYVRVLSMRAGPMRLSRTPRLVATAPEDRLVLFFQESSPAALHQDGRSTVVQPGQVALLDLRRPFTLEQRRQFRTHLVRVPGRALGSSWARTERLTGHALSCDEGAAALLAPVVSALVATGNRMAAPAADRLAGNLADMLATLIDEHTLAGDHRAHTTRTQLLTSVLRYIDDHLRDPELSPSVIADAHRISVRYLHLLFQDEELTVRKLIQRRRVDACARELSRRGRVTPTISVVAGKWGFQNVAHFSRSFKAVYGYSPRDWRRAEPDASVVPASAAD
jgi:AraC-like DNA-binding protein